MRCSTTPRSALLAGLLLLPALAAIPPPAGSVTGEADAVYILEAPRDAPAPPSVSFSGFRQSVRPHAGGWEISVSVKPLPIPAARPVRADWSYPDLAPLSPEFLRDLHAALDPCRDTGEAATALARFLRTRFVYTSHPDDPEDTATVSRSATASCVGLARLASCVLAALGFTSEPVIGLRAPADTTALSLEGGALHVWLAVRGPAGEPFLFDPAFSSGWVPERYVVLRVSGGWTPGDLGRYGGGSLSTLWRRDRLFYFPAPSGETLVWASGPADALPGACLSGKLLDGADAPLPGTAFLRGPQGVLAVPLWQGNFCFLDLPAGEHQLVLESAGERAGGESVTLAPMDKKTLVIYSRGERGRGAAHGTGRQPGGPLPP